MSQRATHLFQLAEQQIAELLALISTGGEPLLRRPCPGRAKLGDGTVAAVASHIASTYHQIAAFIRDDTHGKDGPGPAHNHPARTHNVPVHRLLEELAVAQRALDPLADLSDEQLDTVPRAGSARFCDGTRTLEQVLAAMLKHQGHQVDAIRTAVI